MSITITGQPGQRVAVAGDITTTLRVPYDEMEKRFLLATSDGSLIEGRLEAQEDRFDFRVVVDGAGISRVRKATRTSVPRIVRCLDDGKPLMKLTRGLLHPALSYVAENRGAEGCLENAFQLEVVDPANPGKLDDARRVGQMRVEIVARPGNAAIHLQGPIFTSGRHRIELGCQ